MTAVALSLSLGWATLTALLLYAPRLAASAAVWNVSTATFSLSFCERAGIVTLCADSHGALEEGIC